MAESNGSVGRFERMEAKLDLVLADLGNFKVDVVTRLTRLETAAGQAVQQDQSQASARSFRWMKIGIGVTFVIGMVGLGLRLVGL